MQTLYRPLSRPTTTRVFEIQPGAIGDPIFGTLHEVYLGEWYVEPYECLSYTWGSPQDSKSINVDTHDVVVRCNLWQALQRIRQSDKARRVWIDGISISQNDMKEKAQQVQMIGDIFQRATRVIVCLGEHADGSEAIFHELLQPSQPKSYRPALPTEDELRKRITIWLRFLSRQFWTRTWIVQEIVGAQEILVQCGPDTAGWMPLIQERFNNPGPFDGAHRVTNRHDMVVDDQLARVFGQCVRNIWLLTVTRIQYEAKTQFTVVDDDVDILSFTVFGHTLCMDRRDKIYAMLALEFNPDVRNAIKVSYEITIAELLVRVMRAWSNMPKNMGHHAARILKDYLSLSSLESMEAVDLLLDQSVELDASASDFLWYVLELHLDRRTDVAQLGRTALIDARKLAQVRDWRDQKSQSGRWR